MWNKGINERFVTGDCAANTIHTRQEIWHGLREARRGSFPLVLPLADMSRLDSFSVGVIPCYLTDTPAAALPALQ